MSDHASAQNCPNCTNPLQEHDQFCSQCGQSTHNEKLPFGHFVMEFLESTIHFDNKIWHTLKGILVNPGKVIKEFNDYKRARYVPPIRFYILVSFVYFLAISTGVNSKVTNIKNTIALNTPDSTTHVNFNIDGFRVSKVDSVTYRELSKIPNITEDQIDSAFKVKHIDSDGLNRKLLQKALLIQRGEISPEEFSHKLLSAISKILFLLMPLFAFLLWLFCGSKKDYYSDMLVFALYIHSLFFILLLLAKGIEYFYPVAHIYLFLELIAFIYLVWAVIYNFDKKKKRWSIFQTFLLVSVYGIIFFAGILIAFLTSLIF
jgi:hypothetical protein